MTMKLLMLITAVAAILAGLLSRQGGLVVLGAAIHLFAGIADLFHTYHDAKLLRSGTPLPAPASRFLALAAQWTERAITVTGLVLVIVTRNSDVNGYALGGWIIWGGALACYFATGLIAREVGGIPLSMGRGGWAVRRDRRGKIRR